MGIVGGAGHCNGIVGGIFTIGAAPGGICGGMGIGICLTGSI